MNQFLKLSNLVNPYPLHNRLRDESPVYQLETNTWIIFKYKDVREGLKDSDSFTSKRKMEICSSPFLRPECQSNLFIATEDPPEFDIHRSAISGPFTKKIVDDFRSNISKQAEASTENIKNRREYDFFVEFSYPYIGNTINQLFGFGDLQTYSESHQWIQALEATTTLVDRHDIEKIESIIVKQKALFTEIINNKKINPANDFISKLVSSKELTTEQQVSALELLYRGGYQTTVHLLSIVMTLLIRNVSIRNKLIETPRGISKFIDEVLRLYSPVPMVLRHATKDINIRGKTIPNGDAVWFSLAAANRDPEYFPNPNEIDFSRASNPPSVAFGYGSHVCLGLYLAKVETEIAIQNLLPLFENLSCPEDKDLQWTESLVFRGMKGLPIINSKP